VLKESYMAVPDLSQIGGFLTHCITELLTRGFEPPLYFTFVAVDGAMVYGRYAGLQGAEGMECDILATHSPESVLAPPLHLMIVDHRGEAARIFLAASGEIHLFLT
jgi:hypothetical protein